MDLVEKERSQLEDDIYDSLVEIQKEEEVYLPAKAFIADFSAVKLGKLGYRRCYVTGVE